MLRIQLIPCVLLITLAVFPGWAMDIVRFESGQSKLDVRGNYKVELLRLALEHTLDSYGPYQLLTEAPRMNALKARQELQSGKLLNVYIAATNPEWESEAIPIRVPVRKGLLSYRLLLVHRDDLSRFEKVQSIDDLKKLTVGLQYGWTIVSLFEEQGFDVKIASNYDGLFRMLDRQRFKFIPRGVNEIFDELEQRRSILSDVVIEPTLALNLMLPTYIFVSPNRSRLAQRLKAGLEIMLANGSFDQLFQRHYADNITQARLSERKILHIENNNLPSKTPLDQPGLWFTP